MSACGVFGTFHRNERLSFQKQTQELVQVVSQVTRYCNSEVGQLSALGSFSNDLQ